MIGEPVNLILAVYVLLGCGIWIAVFASLIRTTRRLPRLCEQTAGMQPPADWPSLSIVVPACNEADTIEAALASLLSQDYPALEIIVIDDRSTDGTGPIVDRLAAGDHRIQAIHIATLPKGWLGKVHALHQGVGLARGEWLLFTDADVHFAPGTLRRAVSYALQTGADHLALLPKALTKGFWLEVAVRSFGLLFLYNTRADRVHRQDNEHAIGIGAFNLVRRRVFDRTPGFEWLRLEPGDDAALGMMIKRAGGRLHFATAEEYLSVAWYPGLGAMFRGLEKNLFGPGSHYQWWRALLQSVGIWALVATPFAGLAAGISSGSWLLTAAAGATFGGHLIFSAILAEKKPIDIFYLLFFPPGLLLVDAMLLWAAYRCLRNDGIEWRGTHYSLSELRAGQRIKF